MELNSSTLSDRIETERHHLRSRGLLSSHPIPRFSGAFHTTYGEMAAVHRLQFDGDSTIPNFTDIDGSGKFSSFNSVSSRYKSMAKMM
jgi:hypothetical protein